MPPYAFVARIVLESLLPQLDHPFEYGVPARLAQQVTPGVRVRVPLRRGSQHVTGFVVETAREPAHDGELSEVEGVVSVLPVLAPEVWKLARAVADRGAGTAADVLRLAIPARAARVEMSGPGEEPGAPLPQPPAAPGHPAGYFAGHLEGRSRLALTVPPGVVRFPAGRPGGERWLRSWAPTLASAAVACLRRGESAILAVPDHRDTDEVEAALAGAGAAAWTARIDATGSNTRRYRAFLSCLAGPRIVIGNRSALYAPATKLGLIAVWDDGDPIHAEPRAPYAHARDVALLRQQQQSTALIFAAYARSTAVERLVRIGWLAAAGPERVTRPRVIVTSRQADDGRGARIPSGAFQAAQEASRDGPVLVQVARPGYAPVLSCDTCREPARCPHCHGPLGLAAPGAAPACRRCGRSVPGWSCPVCGGTRLRMIGVGASRTAEELGRAFPGLSVVVADGEHPVDRIPATPALVIATRGAEPSAEGGYRAVLLLDAARMLRRESLWVAEDCLRVWTNAAALAAPGAPVVLVGVAGPLADAFSTWRHERYAERELDDRALLRLPPAVRIATVTGRPAALEAAREAL
ncbi:MAG TPA: primosomal protein N', partial [Microbacteriaceae bacterium]|nr:primosomal protein N' [Microbacteriaceae bacterium]